MTRGARVLRRFALASQAACVTSVGLYALCRAVQAAFSVAPSPAIPARMIAGAHAGYFWRLWTVSYAGVMVGFLVFAVAPAHESKVARGLILALSVAVGLIVVQTIFVP